MISPHNIIMKHNNIARDNKTKHKRWNTDSSDDSNGEELDYRTKWFEKFTEYSELHDEKVAIGHAERDELHTNCRQAYEEEKSNFINSNPLGSSWLYEALRKGTFRDRAKAAAFLVSSNAEGNLDTLTTLIEFTRIPKKCNKDIIMTITDLWVSVLLPSTRKLYPLGLRGTHWRKLMECSDIDDLQKRRICAYWYFENSLKEKYYEFLQNLNNILKSKDHKIACIVAASKLLTYSPEREGIILSAIVNKLGDPSATIASKALHNLIQIAYIHPNMCGTIMGECTKLIFRNNISDRAQRFGLCFLSNVVSIGDTSECVTMVNTCFALFKKLVQKCAVNKRMMQSILYCLQTAIRRIKGSKMKTFYGNESILAKDTEDTLYRLAHFADIQISMQTFGLLLQLITEDENSSNDRFYNALYHKMLDLNLYSIGSTTASHFLHIIHKSIHIDRHLERVKSFIKRLFQMVFYTPCHISTGILIVINKLFTDRKELATFFIPKMVNMPQKTTGKDSIVSIKNIKEKSELKKTAYDAYHRVPLYAGAQYATFYELVLMRKHFHPTISVFSGNIVERKPIQYYGDPLRDFALTHFLDRFSFKNPKKNLSSISKGAMNSADNILHRKRHICVGTRSLPVKSLTSNCTEDEIFIFNYLDQKRNLSAQKKHGKDAEKISHTATEWSTVDQLKDKNIREFEDVNDDEFATYLNGYFGKEKSSIRIEQSLDSIKDIDFMNELQAKVNVKGKVKNKKGKKEEIEDSGSDWSDEDDEDSENEMSLEQNDSEGSCSEDADENDFPNMKQSKQQKRRSAFNDKASMSFVKKLKQNDDVSELFADVDNFSKLFDNAMNSKSSGTVNCIHNSDKSSEKQLKWENKRQLKFQKKI